MLALLLLASAAAVSGCTSEAEPVPSPLQEDGCPPELEAAVADREGLSPVDPETVLTEWGLTTRYVPVCAFEADGTVEAFFPHEDSALLVDLEQDLLTSGYTVTTGTEQHPELTSLLEVVASSDEWELALRSHRFDDAARPYGDVFVQGGYPFDYVLATGEAR